MKLGICVAVGKPVLIVQPMSVGPASRDWVIKSWFAVVPLDEILEIEGSGYLYELKTYRAGERSILVVRPRKGVVISVASTQRYVMKCATFNWTCVLIKWQRITLQVTITHNLSYVIIVRNESVYKHDSKSVFFSPWICNVIPKKWSGHTLTSLTMYSGPLVRPFYFETWQICMSS